MGRSGKYVIAVIVIVVLLCLGYFSFAAFKNSVQYEPGNASLGATNTSPWTDPNSSSVFLSRDLGIAFQYGPGASAEATGTKVFVFAKGEQPENGQSVEVFKKDPSETLEKSIRRQILNGFSESCDIEIAQTNKYEGGNMTAEIVAPSSTDPNAPASANAAACNGAYAKTNGIRFFLYDTNHPTLFAFINAGQSAILSGEGQEPWQDTIHFIP